MRSAARSRRRSSRGPARRRPSERSGPPARRPRPARRPGRCRSRPAAGWTQMSANGPSASSRVLATQLSATPPARARFSALRAARAASEHSSSSTSSSTAWTLAARSAWRSSKSVGAGRAAAGASAAQSTPLGPEAAVAGGVHELAGAAARCRGVPYEAIAITLYSSLERSKPRWAVRSSYSRPSECGSAWAARMSSFWSRYSPRQHRGRLAAAVGHQHRAVAERAPPGRRRRRGRRGAGRSGSRSGS